MVHKKFDESYSITRGLTLMSKRMGLAIETIDVYSTQANGWCEDRVSFLAWHAAETAIKMVWEPPSNFTD